MYTRLRCILWAGLIAGPGVLWAADPQPTADALRLAVDRALFETLSQRPAPTDGLTIEQPERQSLELGAVVDVRRPDPAGLPVVAVSPGAAAERLGLKVGDRLMAINGLDVAGVPAPAQALLQALQDSNGDLTVQLLRGSVQLTLAGSVDTVTLPAYRLVLQPPVARVAAAGCALISGGAKAYGDVRKVEIVSIDGVPVDGIRHQLAAGRHTLVVRMVEKLGFLDGNLLRQRLDADRPANPRRDLPAPGMPADTEGAHRETLPDLLTAELDVAPNTRYVLGARAGAERPEVFVFHQEAWTCPGG